MPCLLPATSTRGPAGWEALAVRLKVGLRSWVSASRCSSLSHQQKPTAVGWCLGVPGGLPPSSWERLAGSLQRLAHGAGAERRGRKGPGQGRRLAEPSANPHPVYSPTHPPIRRAHRWCPGERRCWAPGKPGQKLWGPSPAGGPARQAEDAPAASVFPPRLSPPPRACLLWPGRPSAPACAAPRRGRD